MASRDVALFLAQHEPEDRVRLADEACLERVARAFARVIDAKSPWTVNLSQQVGEIAASLAAILGLDARRQRDVIWGALQHDIGKLGISNRILDKPAGLTAAERAAISRHPELTHNILKEVAAFGAVAELAASHHERLDGKGYHRGLPGEMLPIEARIVKVADIYQALSVDRPYRAALSWEEIQEIMQPDVGASICPEVFDALCMLVEEGPAAQPALEDAWRVA